jgi:uncharacterized membrane protein
MREYAWRSVLKAVSWRGLATLDTILLAFIFTGSVRSALSIGGLEVFTKTFLYVLHERGWQLMRRGQSVDESGMLAENKGRSVLKTFSWRTIGALDTFVISFIITGHPTVSLSISGAELVTKIFLYYMHERVWTRLRIGLVHPVREQGRT